MTRTAMQQDFQIVPSLSNESEDAIKRAVSLQNDRDWVGAARVFHWLADNSQDRDATARFLFCEVSCYAQSGNFGRAWATIQQADELGVTDREILALLRLGRASINFAEGKYNKAAQELDLLLKSEHSLLSRSENQWLRCEIEQRLGFSLFKLGEVDQASSVLANVLTYCEDPTDALIYLARIDKLKGHQKSAEMRLRTALAEQPLSIWALFELGCLYLEGKRFDEARALLERCRLCPPDWALPNEEIDAKLALASRRS